MKVVLASRNKGKLREFQQILKDSGVELIPISEFPDLEDVEETGNTFLENAHLKAWAASKHTGLPALGDDSGLAVDALDGAPGIYSARYAGNGKSDIENCQKLLLDMKDIPADQRSAAFICVLVLAFPDGREISAIGKFKGYIADKPMGENGFGYDPIFIVPDRNCSAAQLTAEEKNAISHRGKAARALAEKLKGNSAD